MPPPDRLPGGGFFVAPGRPRTTPGQQSPGGRRTCTIDSHLHLYLYYMTRVILAKCLSKHTRVGGDNAKKGDKVNGSSRVGGKWGTKGNAAKRVIMFQDLRNRYDRDLERAKERFEDDLSTAGTSIYATFTMRAMAKAKAYRNYGIVLERLALEYRKNTKEISCTAHQQ